jgi:hypothetical protein
MIFWAGTLFFAWQMSRLFYAIASCPQPAAIPWAILLGAGAALFLWSALRKERRCGGPLITLICYCILTGLTFTMWGNLRGSTLGALKGAYGLTSTVQGNLPPVSPQELVCLASHWSLSSFVITESKTVSLSLLAFALIFCVMIWRTPRPAPQREPTR